ncbi:hypothetical protein Ctob_006310 [Chrysochromulina tobinii]|uniref:Uncharacterized protein n=1 Tax=Chrysochromulina tobinii TaxID=1460289 RepID=A0A0M0JEI0_9EUKA|nr:hypothetical protein Ctob_006310 [Chrysochromulina tobinii]|eukprot:KOO24777.1 hypothetical protein Ctob_006310 [Chrysochromulina sp. CCMP291]
MRKAVGSDFISREGRGDDRYTAVPPRYSENYRSAANSEPPRYGGGGSCEKEQHATGTPRFAQGHANPPPPPATRLEETPSYFLSRAEAAAALLRRTQVESEARVLPPPHDPEAGWSRHASPHHRDDAIRYYDDRAPRHNNRAPRDVTRSYYDGYGSGGEAPQSRGGPRDGPRSYDEQRERLPRDGYSSGGDAEEAHRPDSARPDRPDRGYFDNAIPARCLTPYTYELDARDDAFDAVRSEGGRSVSASAYGGYAASVASSASRSLAASLAATAYGVSIVPGSNAVSSHALAEGFWTAWRQKQLPPGVPASGQVAVICEVRYDCPPGGSMTTRHDGAKYERYVEQVRAVVETALGPRGVFVCVPADRARAASGSSSYEAHWQTPHGPRLGAFELQACFHSPELGLASELLFSKLLTRKWPNTARLERMLRGFTRTVVLRPYVRSDEGDEIPAHPLPPELRVRNGSAAPSAPLVPTEVVTVGALPFGPRTLTGAPVSAVAETHEASVHEARERIAQFMHAREVVFNGAGEPNLPSVAQAWDVLHTNPQRRAANMDVLQGIARILKEYPQVLCEVHGETGRANSAPMPLAELLRLDPVRDVAKCMGILAHKRAQACLDALVAEGVPQEQLFVTHKGMGGKLGVQFMPSTEAIKDAKADAGILRNKSTEPVKALSFTLTRGCESEVYVTLGDECTDFEPFAVNLHELIFGLADVADGPLDVPVRLTPRAADFELPIEFVRPGSNARIGSGSCKCTLRATGRRAPGCTLPRQPFEVISDPELKGRHTLAWQGYVEGLELVNGGPAGQTVATWPGLHGVPAMSELQRSANAFVLPQMRLAIEPKAIAPDDEYGMDDDQEADLEAFLARG